MENKLDYYFEPDKFEDDGYDGESMLEILDGLDTLFSVSYVCHPSDTYDEVNQKLKEIRKLTDEIVELVSDNSY
jgi:hypothetical protein